MTKVLRVPASSGQMALRERGSDFDIEHIRADFPILHRKVRGQNLVYLDNAATSQKPKVVIEAIGRYYERDNANIHRGLHYLSERATAEFEAARKTAQTFLHAAKPEEIVFVRGATEAINLVAQTYGRSQVFEGDEVFITAMEHHSNIVPWQRLCEEKHAHLRVAPINDDGELILEEIERLLGPRTKIVAVSHVSNALGTINPIAMITEMAHAKSIPVLVDGAQAVPRLPVNVQELNCDFYVFSGHKAYGPRGIGVWMAKRLCLKRCLPIKAGET